MAIFSNNQHIAKYEVIRLIKENNYCETYRVEDEKEEPFFLKLFILKNTPERMLDENHKVACIDYMSKLRHKNIVSYVEQGIYSDEQVGECDVNWDGDCFVTSRCQDEFVDASCEWRIFKCS